MLRKSYTCPRLPSFPSSSAHKPYVFYSSDMDCFITVMTRCEVIGCRAVTDCISTPAGAVCLCKGTEAGRLCQLDVSNQTEWGKHWHIY